MAGSRVSVGMGVGVGVGVLVEVGVWVGSGVGVLVGSGVAAAATTSAWVAVGATIGAQADRINIANSHKPSNECLIRIRTPIFLFRINFVEVNVRRYGSTGSLKAKNHRYNIQKGTPGQAEYYSLLS